MAATVVQSSIDPLRRTVMTPKSKILLGLLALGGTTLTLTVHPVVAQTYGGYSTGATVPTQDLPQDQNQNSDPFSRNGNIESMFDLIHRANFGQIRSLGEFQQDQRQNINSEAERFRQQQQMRLQPSPQRTTVPQQSTPAPAQPQ